MKQQREEPSDGRRRWSGKDDETLPPGWEVKPETEAYQLHAVGDVDSILTWRGIAWQLPDEGDEQDTETFGDDG